MAGEEDIQARAKEFFALWQEQASMLMRDPDKMAEMLKTLLVLQGACYTPPPDAIQPNSVTNAPEQPHSVSPIPDALPVLELTASLARCEARIAGLESTLAKQSRPTHRSLKSLPITDAA